MIDKKTTSKKPAASSKEEAEASQGPTDKGRKLRLPPQKFLRFRRIKHPVKLPTAWTLAKQTYRFVRQNWKLLVGIVVVYALLSVIFVHGLGSTGNAQALRQQFVKGFGGDTNQLSAGISSFTTMFADSTGSSTAAAGVYQIVLGVMVSLAVIWALRQRTAEERVGFKDAFYKGMTPFVPFFLVLVVMLLQALPFIIGGGIYNIVVTYGIAITTPEKALWALLFFALTAISLYMLCSSLFALYIVTLPDMTPLKALRSARQLVRYRRLSVFRKLLFLTVVLVACGTLVMLPVVFIVPVITQWVFFLLGIIGLILVHTYLYTLYRELLV